MYNSRLILNTVMQCWDTCCQFFIRCDGLQWQYNNNLKKKQFLYHLVWYRSKWVHTTKLIYRHAEKLSQLPINDQKRSQWHRPLGWPCLPSLTAEAGGEICVKEETLIISLKRLIYK